jgi:hypothetical protein
VVGSSWWDSWAKDVVPYAVLLRLFVSGSCSADEFEVVFLRLYLDDGTDWPDDIFDVLDGLFASVDEYCSDDALRQEVGGIDGEQLRLRAGKAFETLRAIAT